MDAWETLLDKSSLETGDAWDHLSNQAGGGISGGHSGFTYVEEFTLVADMSEYEMEIEQVDFELESDSTVEYEVEIEDQSFEIEVD